ncbi:MAG: pilus assembly protein [Acidobacteria bacterium]|nr:pilus assembly protein [Acidobacteriota bacterium]
MTRHRDASRDRGAAMIELALTLTLLMMLLVGTVTSAIAFGQQNSIQNAAREASRFAATLPGAADITWLRNVRDVARGAALGDLETSVQGQYICVAYYDGSTYFRMTDIAGTEDPPAAPPAALECFSDGRPAGEARVQVVTQRDTSIQAVVFSTDVTLSAPAVARYERAP